MIKKVLTGPEFKRAFLDLEEIFREENGKYGHALFSIDHQSVIDNFAHTNVLNNLFHCWVNWEDGKADGIIIFSDIHQPFLNQRMWYEQFWVSKNPKKSFALYREAVKFAKKRDIPYIVMNCVENYPTSPKLKKIYEKLGFKKDSESYIKKL